MYENEPQNNQNEQQNNNGWNNMNNQSQNDSGNNRKNRKTNKLVILIIVVVVVLCFALLAVAGYVWLSKAKDGFNLLNSDNTTTEQSTGEVTTYNQTKVYEKSDGLYVMDVSDIVEQNMPSVVAITSTTLMESGNYYDFYDFYFGGGNENKQYKQQAAGSGIIVKQTKSELLIVTNNHVVEDADSLKIQFNGLDDEKDAVDGYVKGTDSTADVAIVAVKLSDIPKKANIKVATLGDSDSVKVGDGVIAIGNALGYGQSVTSGIISAKDREVELDNGTMTLLQTDAAINGGNSGGALLNASGEVIGINVAKYSSSGMSSSASIEGMGFAIPISSVTDIIGDLENMKTRQKVAESERGYLGINGSDVSEEDALFYDIPQGVIVTSIGDDSPAKKAGMEEKDIITSIDGQAVKSMQELQGKLEYYKAGEKVKVVVQRNSSGGYKEKEITVTLGDSSVLK